MPTPKPAPPDGDPPENPLAADYTSAPRQDDTTDDSDAAGTENELPESSPSPIE